MMMKVLQPIAYEIFMGITQLFEYYVTKNFSVFSQLFFLDLFCFQYFWRVAKW
jgi:hypothetical protein